VWLAVQPRALRDGVEVVAMDSFTGFKPAAAAEGLPDAVPAMDPFQVAKLAGAAIDQYLRRV